MVYPKQSVFLATLLNININMILCVTAGPRAPMQQLNFESSFERIAIDVAGLFSEIDRTKNDMLSGNGLNF